MADDASAIERTLGLLTAVERDAKVSQRSLAGRLGVALGLTNAMLRRCVRKGLIKVSDIPARRYAYYLTPKGMNEKGKLTAEYLRHSLDFFRRARTQYAEIFALCEANGWSRIALAGAGELTEIARVAGLDCTFTPKVLIDPDCQAERVAGMPVVATLAEAGEVDVVIVTDSSRPQVTYDRLARQIPRDRLLAPELLHISQGVAEGGL